MAENKGADGGEAGRKAVLDGRLEGEVYHADFRDEMTYGDYLQLDKILDAQTKIAGTHDEVLFIIIHQVKELWMKLMVHELTSALAILRDPKTTDLRPAFKMLARLKRIQEQLIQAWSVLTTMTPSDYLKFREGLGHSSGFQSYQYRAIEFMFGNKHRGTLKPHEHKPDIHAWLEGLLDAPSLYDEVIKLLARRGLPIDAACLERDWSENREPNDSVRAAWKAVYMDTDTYWDLYELGEDLMDIDDLFQTWRFRHANTVERIIGHKTGTGGTSGVTYLRRAVAIRLFDELWDVRTDL